MPPRAAAVTPPHQLTAEIDRLRDRIAELTRVVAGRALADGPVAGLTNQQTMIVALIAKRGRVSREVMHIYLRANGFVVDDDSGSVRHQIAAARIRLAEHAITIETLPGWGWQMDRESRLVWAHLAAPPAELAALDPATCDPVPGTAASRRYNGGEA